VYHLLLCREGRIAFLVAERRLRSERAAVPMALGFLEPFLLSVAVFVVLLVARPCKTRCMDFLRKGSGFFLRETGTLLALEATFDKVSAFVAVLRLTRCWEVGDGNRDEDGTAGDAELTGATGSFAF